MTSELERICDEIITEDESFCNEEDPDTEFPALPSGSSYFDREQYEFRKKQRKYLLQLLQDPGSKIDEWRRRLRSVHRDVIMDRATIIPGLQRWLQARDDPDKKLADIRGEEKAIWYRADPSLKYLMKVPFFLIGIDHPFKNQQIRPEEEKSWLSLRKAVYFHCTGDRYYYEPRHHLTIYHPIASIAEQYFCWLLRIYENCPELIDPKWRPVRCQYPSYMNRYCGYDNTNHVWNKSCQAWQLGPTDNQEQIIFIGRLDHRVISSFRSGQIVVPIELSTRLQWNNLLDEITRDLPKAIEISQQFKKLIYSRYNFDFSQLTAEQVRGLKDQAPDPAADNQMSIKDFQINQPINLVRRLTQDLGSTIIAEWILTNQVKRCYLYHYDSYHLARPIFLSHAKNLIYNRCFRCNCQFNEIDSQRISAPIGYNLYHQEYGYSSRFDYQSKIFVFPPDQEDIGEFCDNCIDVLLQEGKVV